jgi:hypothetical protein
MAHKICIAYDGDSGILAGFSGVVNDARASSGHLIFNGANASGATGNITVLNITFDVVGSGSSDLDLDYSAMAAAHTFEDLLPLLTVYDGHVQVGPAQYYSLTIAVDPAEGGTTDPEVGVHTYPEGTVVDITAMPNARYEFDHWSGACNGGGTCQVTMDDDKSVTAHFTGITRDLTMAVDPVGGGTTNPAVGVHTYAYGAVVDITAAAAVGYEFDHWSGDCTGSGTCQVTMNADKAVRAYFTELPLTCYTLTLSHTGQGSDPVADPTNSTGCPSGRYIEGESINLSGAIPDAGWQISGWTGTSQDNSTADTNSLTMPASAHAASVVYEVYTYAPALPGGVTTSEPDLSQTIEESEAIATSCSNPDTEVLDSNSPEISTQQVAREQDLTIDPEYSDGNDLTYGTRDSLTYGLLRAIAQLSCVLALLFGLVLSALLVITYRFVSSE